MKREETDDLIVTCTCSHLHHVVRFSFFPYCPDDPGMGVEAYIHVSLEQDRSWWNRLKTAIRYLLNRTCGYVDVSEITLRDQDLPKIRAWVDRAIEDSAKRQ